MKLLLGNPGKPDGWTPSPEVMEISKDDSKIHEFTELFRMSDVSTCEAKPVRLYNLTHDPFEKGCKTFTQTPHWNLRSTSNGTQTKVFQ